MSFKTLSEQIVGLANDVFGEQVTYTPNGDSPVSMNAIFSNAWVDIEGAVLLKPILRIRLSDLESDPGKGDQVSIDSVDYNVVESRLDGFGGSTLILQKV